MGDLIFQCTSLDTLGAIVLIYAWSQKAASTKNPGLLHVLLVLDCNKET